MGTIKGHLSLLLSTVFFASSILCMSEVMTFIPNFKINALRFIIGGMLLIGVSRGIPFKCLDSKTYVYSLLRGCFGVAGYYLLETAALNYISAPMVSILVCFCFIVELMYSMFSERRIYYQTLSALICTLVGMLLICISEVKQISLYKVSYGVLLMVLASISWVVYVHLEKTRSSQLTIAQNVGLEMLLGGVCILPFALREQPIAWLGLPIATYIQVVYLAVFPSALAYLLYNKGSQKVTTKICTLYMNLLPVISIVLITIIKRDIPVVSQCIGMILVTSSLMVVSLNE